MQHPSVHTLSVAFKFNVYDPNYDIFTIWYIFFNSDEGVIYLITSANNNTNTFRLDLVLRIFAEFAP